MKNMIFTLVMVFLSAGCGGRSFASSNGDSGQPPFCPDCNVVLVSLDTLRADSLGTYGYSRATSPNLDRLARKGTVFLNTYAQAPSTFPSHMSIFTSQYPWTHKVVNILRDRLSPETVTLPMLFRQRGYSTLWAAPLSDPTLDLDAGFKSGFNDFIDTNQLADKLISDDIKSVFAWLERNAQKKFFMFFHTYRVHDPYLPAKTSLERFLAPVPSRYLSREDFERKVSSKAGMDMCQGLSEALNQALARTCPPAGQPTTEQDITDFIRSRIAFWEGLVPDSPADIQYYKTLYDAGVFEADAVVGALYRKLEQLDLADKTILIVTSDHGEEFMEHGRVVHAQLYRETLHVPLIFVFPRKKIGRKIPRTAQSIDIMPTILEAVGIAGPVRAEGRSLLPQIKGDTAVPPIPLTFAGPWDGMYSVRDNRYTYLVNEVCANSINNQAEVCQEAQLYDRAADSGELNNIFPANREAAAGFAAALYQKIQAASKRPQRPWAQGLSEESKRRIMKTGYW